MFESPPGVGFSYCDACVGKPGCDCNATDMTTASDNFDAVTGFLKLYPELAKNEFFITGESYAGMCKGRRPCCPAAPLPCWNDSAHVCASFIRATPLKRPEGRDGRSPPGGSPRGCCQMVRVYCSFFFASATTGLESVLSLPERFNHMVRDVALTGPLSPLSCCTRAFPASWTPCTVFHLFHGRPRQTSRP